MGVIPSGTSEPWFWAAREAAANDALARLFHQLADREDEREFRGSENELNRAAREKEFNANEAWRTKQHENQETWRQRQFDEGQKRHNDMLIERQLEREQRANQGNIRYGGRQKVSDIDPQYITPAVEAAWRESEKKHGLPPGTLNFFIGLESAGGRAADRTGSQYKGPFQFGNDAIADLKMDPNEAKDPIAAGERAAQYAALNRDRVKGKINFDGTPNDMIKYYMMHQQGAGGAANLFTNPKMNTYATLGAQRASANGATSNMTNERFIGQFQDKGLKWFNAWHSRTEGGVKMATPNVTLPAEEEGQPVPRRAAGGFNPQSPDRSQSEDYLRRFPGAREPRMDPLTRGAPGAQPLEGAQPIIPPGQAGAALPPPEAVPDVQQPGAKMTPPQERSVAPNGVPGPMQAPPTPPGMAVPPPIVRSPTGLPPQIQAAPFPGPTGVIPGGPQTMPSAAGFPNTLRAAPNVTDPLVDPSQPAPHIPQSAEEVFVPPQDAPRGFGALGQPRVLPPLIAENPFKRLPGSNAPLVPRSVKTERVTPPPPSARPAALPPTGGGSVAPSSAAPPKRRLTIDPRTGEYIRNTD